MRSDQVLFGSEGWDRYWARKRSKGWMVYDAVATAYRSAIIKRRLNSVIKREFVRGAHLLHAGCGSGQVDVDLHDHVRITAVDSSIPALQIYVRKNPKTQSVKHASILDLPFADASFDGAYNLGVAEHFDKEELQTLFREIYRVIRPGGKMVVFWPHAYATSVAVLNLVHFLLNEVLKKDVRLHPPEVSLIHSKNEARTLVEQAGLELDSYVFGPADLFVHAIVVAKRPRMSGVRAAGC